jgi:hypothetical protein
MNDDLNDETFMIFAIKAYNKPNCVMSEFYEDLKRIKYVKRLFIKYYNNKDIKERLIINHLIIIYNVFGANAATRILFYKIDGKYHHILKTFLIFLNQMPKYVMSIRGKTIRSSDIPVDLNLADILRKQ